MALERPTLQDIVTRIESDLLSKIAGSTTFLRRSVLKILSRIYAGAIHLSYGHIEYLTKQFFILTADTTFLELLANELGISRKAGGKATGQATTTGNTGLVVDAGTRLQSDAGNVYTVNTNVTLVAGSGTLDVTAEDYGDEYNEAGGSVLSFISPVSGIDSTVTVLSSGLTGGLDAESDDDLRDRVLTRKRIAPHGGAEFDYETWMLECSGVTRAWAISEYLGIGTIGCAFVRDDDTSIIPTPAQRTIVENYLISHTDPLTGISIGMPVTAHAGLYMIPLIELAVNLDIGIYPNTNAIQTQVRTNLIDCIKSFGGPGQSIALSQLYEAIGSASGEIKHRINSPVADVAAATNQVHVLGDITFEEY